MFPKAKLVLILLLFALTGCAGNSGTTGPPSNFQNFTGTWAGTWTDGANSGTMTMVIAVNGTYSFEDSGSVTDTANSETQAYSFAYGDASASTAQGLVTAIDPSVQVNLNDSTMLHPINLNWSGSLDISSDGHLVNSTPTSFFNIDESDAPVVVYLTKQDFSASGFKHS